MKAEEPRRTRLGAGIWRVQQKALRLPASWSSRAEAGTAPRGPPPWGAEVNRASELGGSLGDKAGADEVASPWPRGANNTPGGAGTRVSWPVQHTPVSLAQTPHPHPHPHPPGRHMGTRGPAQVRPAESLQHPCPQASQPPGPRQARSLCLCSEHASRHGDRNDLPGN